MIVPQIQLDNLNRQHPLNRESLRLLKAAQQSPDPSSLYCVQLMQWGIDSGLLTLAQPGAQTFLLSMLDSLRSARPDQAMKYLLLNDAGDPLSLEQALAKLKSPEEAARLLLESLEDKMSATVPGYPPLAVGSSL